MLSIGNKKYRNLQEQVGYNTECIQELAKAIDGITLEDKLVIIANDSGTFTDEEMTVLNGPLAFISDGSKVWLKQSETVSEFVFKAIDIVATEVGGTHYNVGGSKIVVTRATRAYATSDDVIIVTYNKSQMNSLFALKADLSGANFTGAITAPSIIENMSGYSFIKRTPPVSLEYEYVYAGAVKNGNKLTVVIALNITRLDSTSSVALGDFVLPQDILDNLFPTTIGLGNYLDIKKISAWASEGSAVEINSYFSKTSGKIVCYATGTTLNNIPLNTKSYFRYEATFLLSDNLAQ